MCKLWKKKSSLSLFEEIYSLELIPYDFAKTNKDTSQDNLQTLHMEEILPLHSRV